jgi:nanoRNase/pAp phosphatase (c-di-AMP/oligoRNAs hydrolase)
VVSDREGLGRTTRAGQRQVRQWASGAPRGAGRNDARFRGDPCDPTTYEWTADAASVSAVIDLESDDDAAGALAALRRVRPDAAVLVLSDGISHPPGDGTLTRAGDLRDVVRLDLDDELQRLEAERRVHQLREFVADHDVVPIFVHPDPDPDAISSAVGLRTVLRRRPETLPIVTLQSMTRSENRRMVELLHATITEVTVEELQRFPGIITVDTQPTAIATGEADARFAVVDHHPREPGYGTRFCDIRPEYGATATLIAEYLRIDARVRIAPPIATALLYGIKTDTDGLMRGVTPADVDAYAFLQARADLTLLRRFERPAYPADAAVAYGRAIAGLERDNDLAVVYAGQLDPDRLHVLADLADFCLGIDGVIWSAAAAMLGESLVVTLRHLGRKPGAGTLARNIAEAAGDDASGGGHATMARVTIPASAAARWLGGDGIEPDRLLRQLRRAIERLTNE